MKKLNLIWMILLCFLLTACSSEFAKREYNSDEKISQKADRYAKEIFLVFKIAAVVGRDFLLISFHPLFSFLSSGFLDFKLVYFS